MEKTDEIELDKLSTKLNTLQGSWLFYITGGEPFLEKKIIDICREITKKHYISLNTNLSLDRVYEFADSINPERVITISAAVHVKEREKRDKNLKAYIDKICYLQNKGFNIVATYVISPDLINQVQQDVDLLKSGGVEKVRIKVFRGVYQGKRYPSAYSEKEKALIQSLETDYPEIEILLKKHNYYGLECRAGLDFFTMDRKGNLKRCSSITRSYGNFFESALVRDKKLRPCPIKSCNCPYEGIRNVTTSKSDLSSVMTERGNYIFMETKRIINQIIKDPKSLKKINYKIIEYFAK